MPLPDEFISIVSRWRRKNGSWSPSGWTTNVCGWTTARLTAPVRDSTLYRPGAAARPGSRYGSSRLSVTTSPYTSAPVSPSWTTVLAYRVPSWAYRPTASSTRPRRFITRASASTARAWVPGSSAAAHSCISCVWASRASASLFV